ncbi:MAG: sigma-70 family RNA polymerase sigma factor [Myxococcota bacterium]
MGNEDLRKPLLAFIRRRVHNPDAAEDLVQEVLLKVWTGMATLRDEERLLPFAYRIARNAIVDHQRAHRRSEEFDEDAIPPSEEPPADNDNALVGAWLRGFITLLSPEKRTALWLADVEGLKQREVATRLGISLSGAKSRIQRARIELRALLEACCEIELDSRGNAIDWRKQGCCGPGV